MSSPVPAPRNELKCTVPIPGPSDAATDVPLPVSPPRPSEVPTSESLSAKRRLLMDKVLGHLNGLTPFTVLVRDDVMLSADRFAYADCANLPTGVRILSLRASAIRRRQAGGWSFASNGYQYLSGILAGKSYPTWGSDERLNVRVPGIRSPLPFATVFTTAYLEEEKDAEETVRRWMDMFAFDAGGFGSNRAMFVAPPPRLPPPPPPPPSVSDQKLATVLAGMVIQHLDTLIPLVLKKRNGDLIYVKQFKYYPRKDRYFLVPISSECFVADTKKAATHNFSYMAGTELAYSTWGVSEDLGISVPGLSIEQPFAAVYCENALVSVHGDDPEAARSRIAAWTQMFHMTAEQLEGNRSLFNDAITPAPPRPTILHAKRGRGRPRAIVAAKRPRARAPPPPVALPDGASEGTSTAAAPPAPAPVTAPPSNEVAKPPPAPAHKALAATIRSVLDDADDLRKRLAGYVKDSELVGRLIEASVMDALAPSIDATKP